MQTFLPFPDFERSARCLDRLRLGKQRVEAYQILRTITGLSSGWANHPAVRMWRDHPATLCLYTLTICAEWTRRGYDDSIIEKVTGIITDGPPFRDIGDPPWLGDPAFHASHRSNLIRKDPDHYGRLGWTEPADLPYVWPVT